MTGNIEVFCVIYPSYILPSPTAITKDVCAVPLHFYTITGTYMKLHFAKAFQGSNLGDSSESTKS